MAKLRKSCLSGRLNRSRVPGRIPNVEPGEFVEMEGVDLNVPRGIYRVDHVEKDMLFYTVGRIKGGASLKVVKVLRRNLPEPNDDFVLAQEMAITEKWAELCDCDQCRANLAEQKKEAAARWH